MGDGWWADEVPTLGDKRAETPSATTGGGSGVGDGCSGNKRSLHFCRDDGSGMASPWTDAVFFQFCWCVWCFSTSDHSFLVESARGALGDGGEAGRLSRRHCPGHASPLRPRAPAVWEELERGLGESVRRCAAWYLYSTNVRVMQGGSRDGFDMEFPEATACLPSEPRPRASADSRQRTKQ